MNASVYIQYVYALSEKMSDSPELELQMVATHVWVVGMKIRSPVSYRAVSPPLKLRDQQMFKSNFWPLVIIGI